MKKFFIKKYRIVTDEYSGFEVQEKLWWFPFWIMLSGTNTHDSVEGAKNYIDQLKALDAKKPFKSKVVYNDLGK